MRREEALARLSEPFDIVIVGGGATGLGAAVDASARGYKVALFEAWDFAKGTSSRSTKLVHGGVRYLAQGNVGLVREALRERGRLKHNAPHVVVDLPFVVPAYDFWSGPYVGLGLKLYDVLAGKQRLGKSRGLTREEVLERIPTARTDGLRGGILYFDGQFDDARLAITLALSAADKGAVLLNYARVTRLLRDGEHLSGVAVQDLEGGREYEVKAKVVINATGVFADQVRKMEAEDAAPLVLASQGAHLILPQKFLPGGNALIIPKTEDGRVVFLIPWKGRTLVGTTDHKVDGIEIDPVATEGEIDMLLRHAQEYLSVPVGREDVLAVFAGLRPLVRPKGGATATRDVSRDHTISTSPGGLVTIVGGKWTTYRKMSEDVINHAAKIGSLEPRPCATTRMKLHGAPEEEPTTDPLDPLAVYGTDAHELRLLASGDRSLGGRIHPNLPVLRAQVVWAARNEMARTLEDVVSRRTRALLLDTRATLEAGPEVARLLAQELGRDQAWIDAQVATLAQESTRMLPPPAEPRKAEG